MEVKRSFLKYTLYNLCICFEHTLTLPTTALKSNNINKV